MPQEKKPKKPMHADHRSRMRARVEKYGLESLAEHEALEYLLYFSIPRADTNPIAHNLLDRFGSFSDVLEAGEKELCKVPGVGPQTARFLAALPEIDRYYLASRSRTRRRLSGTEDVLNYLVPMFRGARQERLLLIALDDRRRILRSVWVQEGDASNVDVDVRRIAAEAVSVGAAGVILAHNHPDGVVMPSREDMASTQAVQKALAVLHIALLDHIILTESEYISMRDTNRMQKSCDLPENP